MNLHDIFDDAHRRICIFRQSGDNKPRVAIWTGLDMPSRMKIAVERGFMTPLNGKATPKVTNWYLFTEKGWAQYDALYSNAPDYFSKQYADFRLPYDAFNAAPAIRQPNEKLELKGQVLKHFYRKDDFTAYSIRLKTVEDEPVTITVASRGQRYLPGDEVAFKGEWRQCGELPTFFAWSMERDHAVEHDQGRRSPRM
jgi:hypothetical protein